VARWSAKSIELGGDNRYTPLVLGPAGVPRITDAEVAKADPELAVLSAMSHGPGADHETALLIALVAAGASVGLDAERSVLYYDLAFASLSEAAKKALQAMDPAKYEFQTEFAKRYFSQGKRQGQAEGKAEGKAELVLNLLKLKFSKLNAATKRRVEAASVEDLDQYAARILKAKTLDDVFKKR
jgi:flagellar biosynthesis/type III secretory pathway protein FliH